MGFEYSSWLSVLSAVKHDREVFIYFSFHFQWPDLLEAKLATKQAIILNKWYSGSSALHLGQLTSLIANSFLPCLADYALSY